MQNRSQALCGGSFTQKIPINPKMLTWILNGIAILFAGASLACQYSIHFKQANLTKLIALLDVDTELSLPTI